MPIYRFPENHVIGYCLGTLILSFAAVIIGQYSISLAFSINREMISHDNMKMCHFQDLSLNALKAGDKSAFKACNGIANEAYGKNFFTQIALSAASLWPLFIALGWMQYHFAEVEFPVPFSIPLLGNTFGYVTTFFLCYIPVSVVITKIRRLSFH